MEDLLNAPWHMLYKEHKEVRDGNLVVNTEWFISTSPLPNDMDARIAMVVSPYLGKHIVDFHNEWLEKTVMEKDRIRNEPTDSELMEALGQMK